MPSDSIVPKSTATKYGKVQLFAGIQIGNVGISNQEENHVRLICGKDTLKEDYNDNCGTFLWNKVPVGIARAIVWTNGFIAETDTLLVREGKTMKKRIMLTDRVIQLQAITVKGNTPALVYRGDTIHLNPQGVSIQEGDVLRNILEQMPGIEVSENSVKVAGKDVERTYVDGKTIFGQDPMNAINNLAADDVAHITVYDEDENKEQGRKNRRGRKRRVLNVESKSKLINSKQVDLIASAGGNMEKQQLSNHDLRYGAGGTFNFFSEKLLVAINGLHNNLNMRTNIAQQMLNVNIFTIPTYSENTFGGVNISRNWEKEPGFYKTIKASYQFARTSTESNTRLEQEYFATEAFRQKSYTNQNRNTSQNNKHSMNTGFDMNDKKWGTFGINYSLFTDHARRHSLQQIVNRVDEVESIGNLLQYSKGKFQEMKGSLNWSKYFGDWNYSITADYTNSTSDQEEHRGNTTQEESNGSIQEILTIPSDGRGGKWQGKAELKRMISQEKYSYVSLSYDFLADNRRINKLAWNKVTGEADLANTYSYRNSLVEHTPKVEAHLSDIGFLNIRMNAGWKHSLIKDRKKTVKAPYNKTFDAFTGEIDLSLGGKLSEKRHHSLNYTINTQLPDMTQLRQEVQNSNPYFISSGNPNLKASTLHKISWNEQYRFNNYGHFMHSKLTLNIIQNSISNTNLYFKEATYLADYNYTAIANSTLSSYDNLNGAWNADWNLSWTYPLIKIKSNLSIRFNASYEHTPYYYNEMRDVAEIKSVGGNVSFSTNRIPRLRLSSNLNVKYQSANHRKSDQSNRILTSGLSGAMRYTPILKYFFIEGVYRYNQQNN